MGREGGGFVFCFVFSQQTFLTKDEVICEYADSVDEQPMSQTEQGDLIWGKQQLYAQLMTLIDL